MSWTALVIFLVYNLYLLGLNMGLPLQGNVKRTLH